MTRRLLLAMLLLLPTLNTVSAEDKPLTISAMSETDLQKRLAKKASFDFKEVPLTAVVAALNQLHVPVRLDLKALRDASIDLETPITFSAKDISLASRLALILEPLDLTYVISDGFPTITTKDCASIVLSTHTYEVQDLVSTRLANGKLVDNSAALIEVIDSSFAPSTWDCAAGPGNIAGHHGVLLVRQLSIVHANIGNLLSGLRKVRATQPQVSPVRLWSPEDAAVTEALKKKIDWELIGPSMEMAKAVAAICHAAGLPSFQVDHRALQAASLDWEQMVVEASQFGPGDATKERVIRFQQVTPAESLRLLLNDMDLTYSVHHETVEITTKDRASTRLITVLYPIEDLKALPPAESFNENKTSRRTLVERDPRDGRQIYRARTPLNSAIMDLVQNIIAPSTWNDVGGPGNIQEFAPLNVLVVSQTEEVQEQIEALLTKLRADLAERAKNPPTLSNAKPEPLMMVGYAITVLPGEKLDNAKIVSLIKEEVASEGWDKDSVRLEFVGNRLIAKNTAKICSELYNFLVRLGYIDAAKTSPPATGSVGGGGSGSGLGGGGGGMF
jgi:hypothetical protein